MVIFKKIAQTIFIIGFITSFGLEIYLSYYYQWKRPKQPQPEIGLISPQNMHGSIVYITSKEKLLLEWLHFGMISCGAMIALIIFYSHKNIKASSL